MVTRLFAALILVAGLAAIALAVTRSDDDATVTAAAPAGQDVDADTTTDASTTTEAPIDPPENLGPRLDLIELDGWFNTTTIDSLDDLDGRVVMVEMWTFGCSNCKARIPHTQELYAKHSDRGFEIVGVHAPEFDYEADVANIEDAVERLGVTWPVALDTDKRNFRAWQAGGRRFWPRTFVIDQQGDIRFDHIGEGAYDELEQTVAWLLDNPPAT
jgi:thiol-disulfide isomerase/thioredoxin